MKEPIFEISQKTVLQKFDEVKEIADEISYSSKTNPEITKILESERDCFFSVHSKNELKNISDKSRVIFLSQGWDFEEIKYLLDLGIKKFVVDNEYDLNMIKNYLKENPLEGLTLLLRLKLKENTLQTEKHFVFGFKADFVNSEIVELKKNKSISKVGIHFHRKTQNMAEWNIKKEIQNTIDEKTLKEIDYMIIGGGLPSVYANTNTKVLPGIFNKIIEMKNWLNTFECKMISEPGRYISAPASRLITNIKAIYENNIILDASVYNSDMDALIVPVKLLVENELEKGQGDAYVLKGITPCSLDLFRYKVYLKNPKVGDKIIFKNAGAYNFTTDFCDLPKIKTIIVENFSD